MAASKPRGKRKSAEKPLERDIDRSAADLNSLCVDIRSAQSTERNNVTPLNDRRAHPDQTLSAAVASMSFAGFSARQVCGALRISPTTLYEHYQDEFEHGSSRMIDRISGSLAQRALAGSDTAAIFLLKTRGNGKFVERQQVDMTVEVTHKAELVNQLAGILSHGITIDAEPAEQKKEAP